MNYAIAQTPALPEIEDLNQPKTTVKLIETLSEPIETPIETADETVETTLVFPLSFPKLADALNAKGLKCNVNTLKGRWKTTYILPAIEGIDIPEVFTSQGVSEFGLSIIAEIISRCVQGQNGMKIAPQVLRDELIERYGLKPVKDSLKDAKDLLDKAKGIKQDSDNRAESTALAKVEAKSELQILQEAIKTLNSAQSDETETYELSEQEKAKLAKRFLAQRVAEQEFLQKLARGEM